MISENGLPPASGRNSNRPDPAGVLWSLTSALLWSTTFITARYLLARDTVDPISLSLFRFLLGGSCLLAIGFLRPGLGLFRVTPKDLAVLAGLGVLGMTGMSGLLFAGQQTTTAVNSSLLMQCNPIFVILLGPLVGERITPRQLLAVIVSLAGCLILVDVLSLDGFHFDSGHFGGDLLVLAGGFCWALYSVLGKPVVQRLGGFTATTWAMLAGGLQLLLLRLVLPVPLRLPGPPDAGHAWWLILYLALFPTALAFVAWYEALKRIPLNLLNIMQYLTPVFTVILAVILLGEDFGMDKAVGAIIVIVGVVLAGWPEKAVTGNAAPAENVPRTTGGG